MKQFITLLFTIIAISAFAQKQITLEDIWSKGTFRAEAVAGFRSMNDGKHYSEINTDKKLVKIGFKDGKQKEIIADFGDINFDNKKVVIDEYAFNANETKILLYEAPENIFRRSILYNVFVYDIKTKTVKKISDTKILHATFSPLSDKVAYVKNNNLFVYNLNTNYETAITKDGEKNKIINGNCDWVYEEEFEFTRAYEWSPNGLYIAYYKFDESKVREFNFAKYDGLYPTDEKFKYPKAGEDNSKVSIYLYNIGAEKSSKVDVGNEEDIYIPRIRWNVFDGQLLIQKLNRLQNKLTVFGNVPGNAESDLIYNEDNKYYIEIKDEYLFLKKQNAYIFISEKDGFKHIYKHDIKSGIDVQITSGNWEVTKLISVDEGVGKIYYVSTESSPLERHLYIVGLDGKNKTKITAEAGTHIIDGSSNMNYFMDTYSQLNEPNTYTIRESNGKTLRIFKDNTKLKTVMQAYKIAPQQLLKIPNGVGDTLNAWVMQPANINDGKQHPILLFQYSGPGSQSVTNSYMASNFWWYQMLAQQGYVIACVDGRGTGFRGQEFKKCSYKQLGKLESDDQIAAAKYFATLPYIDKNRIGIWGWSYGGYMSSICIMKGADVFKTAIAVAPVTNWRYYDNIYTERYMQKPQDNASGYDDNSPVNMVNKLKGNYLLIHGSGDDNVHYQNTMEMINALIKADKEFDSEIYPNRAHGISGGNTRLHLYKRMTKFLLEKL
jgi:dipeptidyl-peptidase 4